jgi:outer membrane protein W
MPLSPRPAPARGLPILAASALAASAVVLSGNTARADATPTGIEVGLRSGYALPLGDGVAAQSGQPALALSDTISGMVPIWVDAGYRLNSNMMLGAYFQYGFTSFNTGKQPACTVSDNSCSARDLMFGAQFHYHFMPDQTIDPWAGVGLGYEIVNTSFDDYTLGSTGSGSYGGFQFVFQAGGDYKVMPNLGIGPFLMFSLGQYSCVSSIANMPPVSCSTSGIVLHEWLTFGIRVAYDID